MTESCCSKESKPCPVGVSINVFLKHTLVSPSYHPFAISTHSYDISSLQPLEYWTTILLYHCSLLFEHLIAISTQKGPFKGFCPFSLVLFASTGYSYVRLLQYKASKKKSSEPRPIVFAGPSGVGKGTLIDLLSKKFPTQFGFSVSQ